MPQKTHNTTEKRDDRTFSSPVAMAFVRTVMARRGVTEAQARQIYRDYLDRAAEPAPGRRPRRVA